MKTTENTLEQTTLAWFENLGYEIEYGPDIAFYDALEANDSAQVLGDETLKTIAQELVIAVRRSVTIDWAVRENARAQIRVIVKRILRKYGYPPDKQERLHKQFWNRLRCFAKNG